MNECLVFGKPDPKVQEIITAVVIKKPGYDHVKADQLEDFVNSKVTDFKKIRGGIIFRYESSHIQVFKIIIHCICSTAVLTREYKRK